MKIRHSIDGNARHGNNSNNNGIPQTEGNNAPKSNSTESFIHGLSILNLGSNDIGSPGAAAISDELMHETVVGFFFYCSLTHSPSIHNLKLFFGGGGEVERTDPRIRRRGALCE